MTGNANVYAQALYDLCREENLCGKVLEEMNALKDVFHQNPEYVRLLAAPGIGKDERCSMLDEAFKGKVEPYVLNFLKLLTRRGHARQIAACCGAYRELYNEEHGILPVTVRTAVTLSDEQRAKLRNKLAAITGKQVELLCVVDEKVLGGVQLDYDGKRVDDTVRNRLDAVRALLQNTML